MQKFRQGDIVTILATVVADFNPDLAGVDPKVRVKPHGYWDNSVYVDASNVEMKTPFFKNGDSVMTPSAEYAEVVGTVDDFTWIRLSNGNFDTYLASDLKHWVSREEAA